jgi:hypothetical protein
MGAAEDPAYSKPSIRHMDELAAESARFYESLHARFDLVFNDVGGGADGTTSPQTDGGLPYRLSAQYLAHPLALSEPL